MRLKDLVLPPEYKRDELLKKPTEGRWSGAEDDTVLERLTRMQSDGPLLKWKYSQ